MTETKATGITGSQLKRLRDGGWEDWNHQVVAGIASDRGYRELAEPGWRRTIGEGGEKALQRVWREKPRPTWAADHAGAMRQDGGMEDATAVIDSLEQALDTADRWKRGRVPNRPGGRCTAQAARF